MTGCVAPAAAFGLLLLQAASSSVSGLDAIDRDISAGVYGNVDRLYVMRGARSSRTTTIRATIARSAAAASDRSGAATAAQTQAGCTSSTTCIPTGILYYKGRDIHTLQSVTKSIAATAIGIALRRGEIRTLEQPFLEHFADKDLSRIDPRLRKATIADLLTMRSGIEWHEQDRPLGDTNTTIQLERSRTGSSSRSISRWMPRPAPSGPTTAAAASCCRASSATRPAASSTTTCANSSSRRLASRISTGRKPRPAILTPKAGCISPAAGLARIGELYLRDGVWNGQRILPERWVQQATRVTRRDVAPGWDYGYQWWITSQDGVDVWAGRGFGGQLLLVIPARDTVAVAYAWNVFGGPRAKPRLAAHRRAHCREVSAFRSSYLWYGLKSSGAPNGTLSSSRMPAAPWSSARRPCRAPRSAPTHSCRGVLIRIDREVVDVRNGQLLNRR